jgi:hypothetical protein
VDFTHHEKKTHKEEMSSKETAKVYKWIHEHVLENVKPELEAEGYSADVFEELKNVRNALRHAPSTACASCAHVPL